MVACGIKIKEFKYTCEIPEEEKYERIMREIFEKFKIEQIYGKRLSDLIFSMVSFDYKKRPSCNQILDELKEINKELAYVHFFLKLLIFYIKSRLIKGSMKFTIIISYMIRRVGSL